MAKYSKKAQDKVAQALHEEKDGLLKTGTGKTVTSRKQAIAIGISEAKKEGASIPASSKREATSKKKKL